VLTPGEVRHAIEDLVNSICKSVVACLGLAPAELAQDVIRQGIHLVGGGGLLRGLDQRLSRATGVPVSVVDAPLECVVLGAGRCIENYEVLSHLFMNSSR
jgi:rod shape-determining protein MreB